MYRVYYKSPSEHSKLDKYETLEKAIESIYNWWKIHHYKPFFVKIYQQGNVHIVDYGLSFGYYYIVET